MSFGGYTKLSSSILASTVWREPDHVRIVWITMLAMADQHGVVEASVPGLADFARVPLPACIEALGALQRGDPYSRTPDHDGRRIEPVDGGWLLLNYDRYRERRDEEARRVYFREKKRASRERSKMSKDVKDMSTMSNLSTQAEAEAEAEASDLITPAAQTAAAPVKAKKGDRRKTHPGHQPGFCDWVCLPKRLVEQYAAQSGEDISTPEKRKDVEERVVVWAQQVRGQWQGRQIGDGIWDFWKHRWREWVATPTTTSTQPWAKEHPREHR